MAITLEGTFEGIRVSETIGRWILNSSVAFRLVCLCLPVLMLFLDLFVFLGGQPLPLALPDPPKVTIVACNG